MINFYSLISMMIIITIFMITISLLIGGYYALRLISTGITDNDNIKIYTGILFIILYTFQCWYIPPVILKVRNMFHDN